MNFDLTAPCKDCPFRTDVKPYLTKARVREIIDAITRNQQTFACHKTVDYGVSEDSESEVCPSNKQQHCAGALVMLENLGLPNQMMRISERLGMYDRRKLKMDSPVYATPHAMISAQE